MIQDKELYLFANDVYDVLAGNKHYCTPDTFNEKYADEQQCLEINCATNTIYIGDFQLKISRKEQQ